MPTRFATSFRVFANRVPGLALDALTLLIGIVPWLIGWLVGLFVAIILIAAAAASDGYARGRGE